MLRRAAIACGFVVAGSAYFGTGVASADEAESSLLSGLPLGSLAETTGEVASIEGLTDVATDLLKVDPLGDGGALLESADAGGLLDAVGGLDSSALVEGASVSDIAELVVDAIDVAPAIAPAVKSATNDPTPLTTASATQVRDTAADTRLADATSPASEAVNLVFEVLSPVVEPVLSVVPDALDSPALSNYGPSSDGPSGPLGLIQQLVSPLGGLAAPVTSHVAPVIGAMVGLTGPAAPLTDQLYLSFMSDGIEQAVSPLGQAELMTSADLSSAGFVPVTTPGAPAESLGSLAAAITNSLDSSQDDQPSAPDSGKGHRPSTSPTPAVGPMGLLAGAPGAVTSADQTGSTSHALLPEQAAQRARLVSAAAHAWSVDGLSSREAISPPVSPD